MTLKGLEQYMPETPAADVPVNAPSRDVPLATKRYIPSARPMQDIVPRLRLLDQLNHRLPGRLILLSAPPGFGKTTLLGEWLAACGYPVAPESHAGDPRFTAQEASQFINQAIGPRLLARDVETLKVCAEGDSSRQHNDQAAIVLKTRQEVLDPFAPIGGIAHLCVEEKTAATPTV
jgi:hypothetical protein